MTSPGVIPSAVMTTGLQLVQYAETQTSAQGFHYDVCPTRCVPGSRCVDCSGLIKRSLDIHHATPDFPTVSALQAVYCQHHGTDGLPLEVAYRTVGAIFFMGPNHGYDGYGPDGHVAFSRGDGYTVEARGHASGVGSWPARGRNWTNAALIPGIDYGGAAVGPLPANVDWAALGRYVRGIAVGRMNNEHDLLRKGSHGTQVAHWQNALNLACSWKLAEDGSFGAQTDQATRNFQRFFHIGQDGQVGPQTRGTCAYVLANHK